MVRREKKKLQSSNCYFFLCCVRVRYGCIGALGFEVFFLPVTFVLHLLIVNFSGSSPTVNVGLLSRTT
jgi:hypothetical protein